MTKWKTYQYGSGVRIRRVGEPVPIAAPVVVRPVIDESLTKAELIAEADKRGLDTSGNKADLVERLND